MNTRPTLLSLLGICKHIITILIPALAFGVCGFSNEVAAQGLPQVSIQAIDAVGMEGVDSITFRFTRTGSTTNALQIFGFETIGDSFAASGIDYSPVLFNNLAVIPSGASFVDLIITPLDDGIDEGTETLRLSLVAGSEYAPGSPATALATIVDFLSTVTIEAIDATGSEDGDTIMFRVLRTGSTTSDLRTVLDITGTISDGDAPSIPNTPDGNFIIPAGSAFADLLIIPSDDALEEGSETVFIRIQAQSHYNVGLPSEASATILDNDAPSITEPLAPDNSAPSTPPVPTCNHIGNEISAVVRAQVSDGTVPDGAVFCRMLNENGTFVGDTGGVGDAQLIALGVLQAVDVFGLTAVGNPVVPFDHPVYVCLRGVGALFYADASYAPRTYLQLSGQLQDGFTCASIPNAGTLVLVQP